MLHAIFGLCDTFNPNISCNVKNVNSLQVYAVFSAKTKKCLVNTTINLSKNQFAKKEVNKSIC